MRKCTHVYVVFAVGGGSVEGCFRSLATRALACVRLLPERAGEATRTTPSVATRLDSARKRSENDHASTQCFACSLALRSLSARQHCERVDFARELCKRVCLFVCSEAPKRTRFSAHANNNHHRPSGHQVNWTYSGGGVIKVSGRTQQMRACQSSCVAISLRCAVDARAFTFEYCVSALVCRHLPVLFSECVCVICGCE